MYNIYCGEDKRVKEGEMKRKKKKGREREIERGGRQIIY